MKKKATRFGHKGCTTILPVDQNPRSTKQELREATHACWCCFWKIGPPGEMFVWRDGAWKKPKIGEVSSKCR